jgi:hypothetical protein
MQLCVIRNFDPDGRVATEEIGRILRVERLRDNRLGVAVLIQEDEELAAE